jgi:hypothetical protein
MDGDAEGRSYLAIGAALSEKPEDIRFARREAPALSLVTSAGERPEQDQRLFDQPNGLRDGRDCVHAPTMRVRRVFAYARR